MTFPYVNMHISPWWNLMRSSDLVKILSIDLFQLWWIHGKSWRSLLILMETMALANIVYRECALVSGGCSPGPALRPWGLGWPQSYHQRLRGQRLVYLLLCVSHISRFPEEVALLPLQCAGKGTHSSSAPLVELWPLPGQSEPFLWFLKLRVGGEGVFFFYSMDLGGCDARTAVGHLPWPMEKICRRQGPQSRYGNRHRERPNIHV